MRHLVSEEWRMIYSAESESEILLGCINLQGFSTPEKPRSQFARIRPGNRHAGREDIGIFRESRSPANVFAISRETFEYFPVRMPNAESKPFDIAQPERIRAKE